MLEFSHITEIPEYLSLEKRAFEYVREERYQRLQVRLRKELSTQQSSFHIAEDMKGKALLMLERFLNKCTGIENLNPSIEFDIEDENIRVNIPNHAISVYLYYNEDNDGLENFEEAFMYYEENNRQIITNNTTVKIAHFVSKLLKK